MSVLTLCGYILAWYSQKASNWHVFMSTIVSIWMHWSPWTLTRNKAVFITMIFVQSQAIKYGICCRTLTFDQPLYSKSFKIKQDNHPQFRHLFLRVGGGVLGWMLVVVLFTPIWRGSVSSVACCTAWYGSTNYSNHPREAAASSYLAIIFGRIAGGIPWFLRSTTVPMHLLHQCRRWCSLK